MFKQMSAYITRKYLAKLFYQFAPLSNKIWGHLVWHIKLSVDKSLYS